jgi:similar to spore coat protein
MAGMIQNMAGMGGMTDQVIATDLLLSAKSGIKNYALALTECATPEVRDELTKQLNTAIETHGKVTNYMISKGYYHPNNIGEQLGVDMQATQAALNLSQQQTQ